MNYIKTYKLFESNDTYYQMRASEMFPEEFGGEEMYDYKIDDVIKQRILDKFPNLSVGKFNPLYIHRSSSTTFIDKYKQFDFDIWETDDEWFFVSLNITHGGCYDYRCDQIEGVFDLIQDTYIKFGFKI